MKRTIVIGDVHGCLNTLKALLSDICPTTEDTLIFLGDYIDRGNFSAQTVEFLIDFQKNYPNTICLRGNHEDMFLEACNNGDAYLFIYNGGNTTIFSYEQFNLENNIWRFETFGDLKVPKDHLDWIRKLPISCTIGDYFFAHAGIMPGIEISKQDTESLLWIRDEFLNHKEKFEKIIVHGHTPVNDIEILENRICVDTGCVYKRKLTAYDLTNKIVFEQNMKIEDKYIRPKGIYN